MEASKYYNMNRYNIKILNFVNTSEKIRINNKQSILKKGYSQHLRSKGCKGLKEVGKLSSAILSFSC